MDLSTESSPSQSSLAPPSLPTPATAPLQQQILPNGGIPTGGCVSWTPYSPRPLRATAQEFHPSSVGTTITTLAGSDLTFHFNMLQCGLAQQFGPPPQPHQLYPGSEMFTTMGGSAPTSGALTTCRSTHLSPCPAHRWISSPETESLTRKLARRILKLLEDCPAGP